MAVELTVSRTNRQFLWSVSCLPVDCHL